MPAGERVDLPVVNEAAHLGGDARRRGARVDNFEFERTPEHPGGGVHGLLVLFGHGCAGRAEDSARALQRDREPDTEEFLRATPSARRALSHFRSFTLLEITFSCGRVAH